MHRKDGQRHARESLEARLGRHAARGVEIPPVLIAQSPYGGYTGVHIAQSPPFPLLRRSADYTDEGGWMRVKLAGAGRQSGIEKRLVDLWVL